MDADDDDVLLSAANPLNCAHVFFVVKLLGVSAEYNFQEEKNRIVDKNSADAWMTRPYCTLSPGNIPETLRYLQKVTKVDLAHNLLEGSVPGGDARWINSMSILLLNNNKLSGTYTHRFPSGIPALVYLLHTMVQ